MAMSCQKRSHTPQGLTFSIQLEHERNPVTDKKSHENSQDRDLNKYPVTMSTQQHCTIRGNISFLAANRHCAVLDPHHLSHEHYSRILILSSKHHKRFKTTNSGVQDPHLNTQNGPKTHHAVT